MRGDTVRDTGQEITLTPNAGGGCGGISIPFLASITSINLNHFRLRHRIFPGIPRITNGFVSPAGKDFFFLGREKPAFPTASGTARPLRSHCLTWSGAAISADSRQADNQFTSPML